MKARAKKSRRRVVFYSLTTGEFRFGCNEEDEAEIVIRNAKSKEDARRKLALFITLLRSGVHILRETS